MTSSTACAKPSWQASAEGDGMLQFLELEEFVGRKWHHWASSAASYARHPAANVELEAVLPALGTFFRAAGGDAGVEVGAIIARSSKHRLNLRQRLGFDEEVIDRARLDDERSEEHTSELQSRPQ